MRKKSLRFVMVIVFIAGMVFARAADRGFASPGGVMRQVKRIRKQLGPFPVNGREYSVVLGLQKIEGAPEGFDETVESLTIVNDRGEEQYRRSFPVAAGEGMFEETLGIGAFALESAELKIFRREGDKLEEGTIEGGANIGLILYFGYTPSAPSSGISCQVFTEEGGRLTPRSNELTVYGTVHELLPGRTPAARRLLPGDTLAFGVWTGWFEVTVPVKILEGLQAAPSHRHLTYGLDAFPVRAERRPPDEETFVRLSASPGDSAPRHVVVRKESKVEFLEAYTKVVFESGAHEVGIAVDEMPWLKVRIDGKEGFVREAEDLLALGLSPAG